MADVWIGRRYGALRFFAGVMQVLGALLMLPGIFLFIAAVAALFKEGLGVGLAGLAMGAAPFLAGLVLFAIGQACEVLIDIEENTRATRQGKIGDCEPANAVDLIRA